MNGKIRQFFFPVFSRRYLLRLGVVTIAAFLIFGYILPPYLIKGESMAPTYKSNQFVLCLRHRYLLSAPARHDIVLVGLSGDRIAYLKRVVALPGETVEFRNGSLLVNGSPLDEPYVQLPCDWNLPPRRVEPGNVYVVGDNRSVPIDRHVFGQTGLDRIKGAPLW